MNHLSEEQLNEYLDHESQERVQIETHLAACAECAARLTVLQGLFRELESLPEVSLSRELGAAVILRLGLPARLPRWLTLTIVLQAALAIMAVFIAAPFIIQFASQAMPVPSMPSPAEVVIQLQTQWMNWLNMLSTFQMPSIPAVPSLQVSWYMILFALSGASILWLVGNGLLLRNQIK